MKKNVSILILMFWIICFTSSALGGFINQNEVTSDSETQENDKGKSVEQLARDGVDTLMRAIENITKHIPHYAAPQVNENGDIIIRKIHPETPLKEKGDTSKSI